MKLKSFKFSDSDMDELNEIKTKLGLVSEVDVVRRGIDLLYNQIMDNRSHTVTRPVISVETKKIDESLLIPGVTLGLSPEESRLKAIREKTVRNMNKPVDLEGRIVQREATPNITNTEMLAGLNNTEAKDEDVKNDRLLMFRKRFPHLTDEEIERAANMEYDASGNPMPSYE